MANSDSIQFRNTLKKGVATIKCIVTHPMETGLRKDKKGNLIPAKFVNSIICEHAGNIVLDAELNSTISTNPYMKFKFTGAKKGDTIKVSWTDNTGASGTAEAEIPNPRRKKK